MSLVVCVATNCETVDLLGQGQRRNDPDGEPETEGIGILSAILGSVKGPRYTLGWRTVRKMSREVGVREQKCLGLAADNVTAQSSIIAFIFQIGTSE